MCLRGQCVCVGVNVCVCVCVECLCLCVCIGVCEGRMRKTLGRKMKGGKHKETEMDNNRDN